MKKTKVVLLQKIIPNYRILVFQRISKLANVDLTVFYSNLSKKEIANKFKQDKTFIGFKTKKIPMFEINEKKFQFSFIKYIIKYKPEVIIAGNAGKDTLLILILSKLLKIKFIWWFGGRVKYTDDKKNISANENKIIYRFLKQKNLKNK